MPETIAQAHERLNYAHYEARLRSVKGLWAQLQKMKTQTPTAYVVALGKHIATLKKREEAEAPLTDDESDKAFAELQELWAAAYEHAWPMTQRRLPADIQDWMQKWAPTEFAAYVAVHTAWRERPSIVTFKAMRDAIPALFRAFEAAA